MTHPHPRLCVLSVVFLCCLSAPAADTTQLASSEPLRIVGGPYLQAPSSSTMTLVWTTNRRCVSRVEYGPVDGALRKTAVSARHGLVDANLTLHAVTLQGLEPGGRYAYRAISTEIVEFKPYKVTYGAAVSSEGRFATLNPKKEKYSFCVLNDRHDKVAPLRQALGSIRWDAVDLVIGLGDMMNDPMSEEQIFSNFINPCAEFFAGRIPLVMVRGNHETRGSLARSLMDYFPTGTGRYYYSFIHGGVHFLVLDGGEDKADSSEEYSGLAAFEDYLNQETRWLEEELQSRAFREAGFRVCLLHIPPSADPSKPSGPFIRAPWIRDHWSPMLSRAGLDLMLSGHTHRYTELPGDEHRAFPIVIGGTDTVIRVDVSPERLELTTYRNDGTMLSRPPAVPRRP